MNSDPHPVSSGSPSVGENRSRQARLWRNLFLLSIAAIGLGALVVWHRDARHIEAAQAAIDAHRRRLATYLAEHKTLPLVYPQVAGNKVADKTFTYLEKEVVRWARHANGPVVIGYGRVEGLIARPNGHPVIYFDNGRLRVGWLARADLDRRLNQERTLARAASAP